MVPLSVQETFFAVERRAKLRFSLGKCCRKTAQTPTVCQILTSPHVSIPGVSAKVAQAEEVTFPAT